MMTSGLNVTKNSSLNNQNLQQDLDFNLKTLIENYLSNQNKHEYDYFLSIIKQKQSNIDFIYKLLTELKHLVDRLEPLKFEDNLVNLIFFDIKWHVHYSKSKIILKLLYDFLADLNSAYTSYIYKCLSMLIKMFTISRQSSLTDSSPATQAAPKEDIDPKSMFNFAHSLIIHLVKIAPTSKAYIVKLVDSLYPYMIKETGVQEAYIKNVLIIADNFKDLRLMLLEICVQKILKIDVNSRREQILEAEIKNDDQLILDAALTNLTSSNDDGQAKPMKHPLADRLDIKMMCAFDFIKQNCIDSKTGQFNWESCKTIYKDLLFTFDKYILFTYGSSHVQFLMFYICSFRSILSEGFLDYLWKKFSAINSCAITRQVCSYYIGSYLSRAKYIPITTCVATLQLMIKWIHGYIEKYGNNSNTLNFDLHRTFYALCQTVFYVVIFRNRQLFNESAENSKMIELIQSWKLNEIISSKLNPLRYCLPTIRKKFARITYINRVAYCYSIIDSNNRISLPISGQSTLNIKMFFSSNQNDSFNNNNNKVVKAGGKSNKQSVLENPLDSFFPFDPYLLNRSKSFVQKFYIEFKDVYDESLEESEDEDEDEDDSEEDDDDMKDEGDSDGDDGKESDMDESDCEQKDNEKSKLRSMFDLNDSDFENSID